ncbi:hypothetical protein TNCV_2591671 [Trichonephila clavipes]|nr:hypothetical protein TNCV_2591671 [Trichonephila clavipes]
MMSRSCGSSKTAQHVTQARATIDLLRHGYVKLLVYADKPQTHDHLEDNIRRVIADIRPQMLEKVIENWTSRLDYIRASRGSHMPEIIFKIHVLIAFDRNQSLKRELKAQECFAFLEQLDSDISGGGSYKNEDVWVHNVVTGSIRTFTNLLGENTPFNCDRLKTAFRRKDLIYASANSILVPVNE